LVYFLDTVYGNSLA